MAARETVKEKGGRLSLGCGRMWEVSTWERQLMD